MQVKTIGDCVLYHGDMRDVMPMLADKADMIFTDPPYELTSGGPNGEMEGKFNKENYNNDGGIVTCDIDWDEFMPLIYAAMKNGTHCYTMSNNRHVQNMLNAAEKAGMRFHNLLAWDKGSCTPNRYYMKNMEFIGFFYKGNAKSIHDCGSQQLIYCPQQSYGDHPTPKPVALVEYYIRNSSNYGDVILDPFMGTAATGIAALKSGRKFIGIELEEKWFDVAVARIEEFYSGYRTMEMFK